MLLTIRTFFLTGAPGVAVVVDGIFLLLLLLLPFLILNSGATVFIAGFQSSNSCEFLVTDKVKNSVEEAFPKSKEIKTEKKESEEEDAIIRTAE